VQMFNQDQSHRIDICVPWPTPQDGGKKREISLL
jgi:hypothetical protein